MKALVVTFSDSQVNRDEIEADNDDRYMICSGHQTFARAYEGDPIKSESVAPKIVPPERGAPQGPESRARTKPCRSHDKWNENQRGNRVGRRVIPNSVHGQGREGNPSRVTAYNGGNHHDSNSDPAPLRFAIRWVP